MKKEQCIVAPFFKCKYAIIIPKKERLRYASIMKKNLLHKNFFDVLMIVLTILEYRRIKI